MVVFLPARSRRSPPLWCANTVTSRCRACALTPALIALLPPVRCHYHRSTRRLRTVQPFSPPYTPHIHCCGVVYARWTHARLNSASAQHSYRRCAPPRACASCTLSNVLYGSRATRALASALGCAACAISAAARTDSPMVGSHCYARRGS